MNGRNEKGQWIKGHASLGGRKKRIDEDEQIALFNQAYSKTFRLSILKKLGIMAQRGDIGAIKLILEYLYGKPIDRKEIAGIGGDKFRLMIEYVNTPYPTTDVSSSASGDTSETEEV